MSDDYEHLKQQYDGMRAATDLKTVRAWIDGLTNADLALLVTAGRTRFVGITDPSAPFSPASLGMRNALIRLAGGPNETARSGSGRAPLKGEGNA